MTKTTRTQKLLEALSSKQAVKVIGGIHNHDVDHVLTVVRAASQVPGVTAVDVAATPEVVRATRANTPLFVFASSIQPAALEAALENGADGVEIGNYDALYDRGIYVSAEDVVQWAVETRQRIGADVVMSVTLPGHLSVDAQIALAQQLLPLNVQMFQTEGAVRVLSADPSTQTLTTDEKVAVTLKNTQALSRVISAPIMSATGIAPHNVAEAFLRGASAVGVGSAISRLQSEHDMIEALTLLVSNIPAHTTANIRVQA